MDKNVDFTDELPDSVNDVQLGGQKGASPFFQTFLCLLLTCCIQGFFHLSATRSERS